MNGFVKSHGLGNEYIVLDDSNISFELNTKNIQQICNVHFGIGSDGILLKVDSSLADFGVQIFNPDGSEAEKSGNGLRIFCKYIYDYNFTDKREFTVETKGGIVRAHIDDIKNNRAALITVDMGQAVFESESIPTNFVSQEALGQTIDVNGTEFTVNCVSVGNPHCVIIKDELSIDEVMCFGHYIETHDLFPNKINVQFAKVISRNCAEILIWERGAGYTLASGSSSCAVACVLKKLDLVDSDIKINMQGGSLQIHIDDQWQIRMTGEVKQTAEGILSPELVEELIAG